MQWLGIAVLAAGASLTGCETTHHVSNYQAVSDATISANVKAALVQDPDTRASNISVNTINGTVELSGFVDTRDQRRAAVRVARSVDGVQSVREELAVNDQGRVVGAANSDDSITRQVQSALGANRQTADARINVTTDDGVVQLSGFVDSNQQRDTAADIANTVQGVRKVDNDLRLTSGD
jgi:hyperosmotically inducible protein